MQRLGVDRVDLLQFHWWTFEHLAWLDALHELKKLRDEGLIAGIGLTNFDAAHLRLALADGIPIATNQVSFSLLDRRAAGDLSALCREKGVKLLAYGTLCGGFISERWLGQPEPQALPDWSRSKYKRFIDVAGGWPVFQNILRAADAVARKHRVSIANVATRWVLDHEAVAAVITQGFVALDLRRLTAVAQTANRAAARVLEWNGFTVSGRRDVPLAGGAYASCTFYERRRSASASAKGA